MNLIVKVSQAKVPGASQEDRYMRIGLLEVEEGLEDVSMISRRAKGVIRVVKTWERLYAGKTERCAFRKALKEAEEVKEAIERFVG